MYDAVTLICKAPVQLIAKETLTRISDFDLIAGPDWILSDEEGVSPNELDCRIGDAGVIGHG